MTNEEQWAYLAGMIDGEGCVYYNPRTKIRCLTISTTDEDLRDVCTEILGLLGVRYKISAQQKGRVERGHAICYDIRVHDQESFRLIYENCPLQSGRKRTKLGALLSSYSRRPYTLVES